MGIKPFKPWAVGLSYIIIVGSYSIFLSIKRDVHGLHNVLVWLIFTFYLKYQLICERPSPYGPIPKTTDTWFRLGL